MSTARVLYETDGRLARIALNRPRYHNAQSGQLLRELDAAFEEARADHRVRVIVLRGAGESFSSGHDLGTPDFEEERARRHRPVTEVEEHFDHSWEHFVTMALRWRDLPKPTIASVHGWCIFGGWMIASAMDLVIAADDARFLTTLHQYFPLPFDIGPRRAKELLFDNHVLSATEALELGFVNRVVRRDELAAATTAWAERIAEQPAFTLRMSKLAVNAAQDAMGFHAAIHGAHSHYMLSQISNSQWAGRADATTGGEPRMPPSLVTDLIRDLPSEERSDE